MKQVNNLAELLAEAITEALNEADQEYNGTWVYSKAQELASCFATGEAQNPNFHG